MNNRYEIRQNWQQVVNNPGLQMLFMIARLTDSPFLKAEAMIQCVIHFVYDTQEQRFLSEEEGSELLTEWIKNGEGHRIIDGIERIAVEQARKMGIEIEDMPEPKSYEEQIKDAESNVDEDGLRDFFNLND